MDPREDSSNSNPCASGGEVSDTSTVLGYSRRMSPTDRVEFKAKVIQAVLNRLGSEREGLLESARAAHEAATHSESAAEDQYDTRGLEASYLAGAQAQRVVELDHRLQVFHSMKASVDSLKFKAVEVGALITLELSGRRMHYFLVGEGGGLSVQVDGKNVNLITPQAPLAELLLGRTAGDEVDLEIQGQWREYLIVEVS